MDISGKLWFMGNWGLKNDEKSVILAITLVFTLQDRTSGDLDLVWLEALWQGFRGYSAAISGKLWLSGKMVKHSVHVREGGPQVLSVMVSHRTSGNLDLVVSVYGGEPLRAR